LADKLKIIKKVGIELATRKAERGGNRGGSGANEKQDIQLQLGAA